MRKFATHFLNFALKFGPFVSKNDFEPIGDWHVQPTFRRIDLKSIHVTHQRKHVLELNLYFNVASIAIWLEQVIPFQAPLDIGELSESGRAPVPISWDVWPLHEKIGTKLLFKHLSLHPKRLIVHHDFVLSFSLLITGNTLVVQGPVTMSFSTKLFFNTLVVRA